MVGTICLRSLLVESPGEFLIGGTDLLLDHEALYQFLRLQLDPEALMAWENETSLSWMRELNAQTVSVLHIDHNGPVDQSIISHTHFLDRVDSVYRSAGFDLDTIGVLTLKGDEENGGMNLEYAFQYAKECCDVATEEFGLNRLDLSRALQQMRSKILLIIFGQHSAPVPLLTKSYLVDVDKCWSKYPDALKEVSVLARMLPSFALRRRIIIVHLLTRAHCMVAVPMV